MRVELIPRSIKSSCFSDEFKCPKMRSNFFQKKKMIDGPTQTLSLVAKGRNKERERPKESKLRTHSRIPQRKPEKLS